jgi:hypothetical protein
MDERSGTIRLVDSREGESHGFVTTISRTEVEKALHADEGPVDLLLDVERAAAEGGGRESERIALAWEPEDLERLLKASSADEITLTFDEEELRRFLDEDVDAHGMREKLAVLTVAAGFAAAGAGAAAAMPVGPDAGGSAAGPTAAVVAPASEISTGLGDQSAPAEATLAVSDHGVLTSAEEAGLSDTSAPSEASLASASEISTGLGDQSAPAEATLAVSDHGVLTSAEEAGLSDTSASAEASASEISTGLGDTAAPAEANLASASEISAGIVGETPASPAEVASGIVQEAPASPAEVTTGIVQQPSSEPVSASPGDSTWSPSGAEAGAIAGAILAISAAGFALRSQRRRPALS